MLRRDHTRAGDQVGQRVLALLDELGQLDKRIGIRRHGLVERLAVEGQEPAVLERAHACRSGLFRDQGHLAEEVVRAHQRDRDGVAWRLLDVDLAAARFDDEHGVAGVPLVDDDRAPGRGGGGEAPGERVEDVVRKREEDGDPLEDLEPPAQLFRRAEGGVVVVAHAAANYR